MIKTTPQARWAAYGAAAAAFGYAVVSLYWAVGGTAGLSTVGGIAEQMARSGGVAAAALIAVIVLLKTLGGLLALALAMKWGQRVPGRALWLLALAWSALLILYGAAEVTGEALAETGAIRPGAADWTALRWHLALWDPWFLVWGLLLAAATWGSFRAAGPEEDARSSRACNSVTAAVSCQTRPGSRDVTSWTSHALPSGSSNEQNDP
jgi:hypothetical protein